MPFLVLELQDMCSQPPPPPPPPLPTCFKPYFLECQLHPEVPVVPVDLCHPCHPCPLCCQRDQLVPAWEGAGEGEERERYGKLSTPNYLYQTTLGIRFILLHTGSCTEQLMQLIQVHTYTCSTTVKWAKSVNSPNTGSLMLCTPDHTRVWCCTIYWHNARGAGHMVPSGVEHILTWDPMEPSFPAAPGEPWNPWERRGDTHRDQVIHKRFSLIHTNCITILKNTPPTSQKQPWQYWHGLLDTCIGGAYTI